MLRFRIAMVAACLGPLLLPPAAVAQEPDTLGTPVAIGVVNGLYARPVGEFHDHVKGGGGFDGGIVWPPRVGGPLAFRADLGLVVYGSESRRVCFSGTGGCRVDLDLTTTNSILLFHVGPQLMLPSGPVRPYANAGIGLALFSTDSEVEGTNQDEAFASTTNHSDFTLSWTGGTGIMIPLRRGPAPASLDIGLRYVGNGEVEYLKEGDIRDEPDGSITVNPTRSQANLVSFRIGFSVWLRIPGAAGP